MYGSYMPLSAQRGVAKFPHPWAMDQYWRRKCCLPMSEATTSATTNHHSLLSCAAHLLALEDGDATIGGC